MAHIFTVPTKDICILCLTQGCTKGSSKVKLQPICTYLGLDLNLIFNIKGEINQDDVEIEVTLCKSCCVMRNAFCEMYEQLLEIQKKMDGCILGMRNTMIKAENNVANMKEYFNVIAGRNKKSLEVVRASIPEKFRRETIAKSAIQETIQVKKQQNTDLSCSEEIPKDEDLNGTVVENELEKEILGDFEQNSSKEYVDEDEDDDPEVLMMKYNSRATGKGKKRKQPMSFTKTTSAPQLDEPTSGDSSSDTNMSSGLHNGDEGDIDMEDLLELNGIETDDFFRTNTDTDTESSPNKIGNGLSFGKRGTRKPGKPGTYGARFECNLCGKVVVSLKNFELHQRRHAGEKPFECELCQKTFRDTSNLRSHVLRYHRHYLFIRYKADDMTVEEFQKGVDLLITSVLLPSPNHSSSTLMSHACQLCDRSYTQRYAIEDHIVQRHYDVISEAIYRLRKAALTMTKNECIAFMTELQQQGNTSRSCGLCGQRYDTAEGLNNHVKTHVKVNLVRKQKNYDATGSPTTTAYMSSALSTTQRLITLKLKCEPCNLYFSDLTELNNHKLECVNQSGTSALFKCDYCGKCLNSFHNHRRHLLSLHRFEVFSKYLPTGTTAARLEEVIFCIFNLNKAETVGEGFKCFLCEKIITQKRKLMSHVLATHFDKMVSLIKKGLATGLAIDSIEGESAGGIEMNGEDNGEVMIEIDEDYVEDESKPSTPKLLGGEEEIPFDNEDFDEMEDDGSASGYMFGLSSLADKAAAAAGSSNSKQMKFDYGVKTYGFTANMK